MLPTHLMEERLIRQQQEMEEDQRWLEKEERFLVTAFRKCPSTLRPAGLCGKGSSFPKQESWLPLQFLRLEVVVFALLELLFQGPFLRVAVACGLRGVSISVASVLPPN